MHSEIIDIEEFANLRERSTVTNQEDIGGMMLYTLNFGGRDVHVTQGASGDAVVFSSKADGGPIRHAIQKPIPTLTLLRGGMAAH